MLVRTVLFLIYTLNRKKNRAHFTFRKNFLETIILSKEILCRVFFVVSLLYSHAFSSLTTWYCIITRIYVHVDNFFLSVVRALSLSLIQCQVKAREKNGVYVFSSSITSLEKEKKCHVPFLSFFFCFLRFLLPLLSLSLFSVVGFFLFNNFSNIFLRYVYIQGIRRVWFTCLHSFKFNGVRLNQHIDCRFLDFLSLAL